MRPQGRLAAMSEAQRKVMGFDEREAITDPLPLKQSLFMLAPASADNGTLIGAGANLTVARLSERTGVSIRFLAFLTVAVPAHAARHPHQQRLRVPALSRPASFRRPCPVCAGTAADSPIPYAPFG